MIFGYYEFQYEGIRRKKSGFTGRKEAELAEALEKEKIRRQLRCEYEVEEQFSDYIQEWMNNRRNLADNTKDVYQVQLNNHKKPYFQNKTVNQIKPIYVKRFIDSLHEKNLSSGTIKKAYNIINKFFNDQVKLCKFTVKFIEFAT